MKFPHLDGATPFPGADAHVYEQYTNVYDYHMWTPNTKIKLCRVKWRDDGRDAVKFVDDGARDAWFDALDGEAVTVDTSMYIARADTDGVKIPVPYMTAQRYNYLVVDFSADIMRSPLQQTDCQTRYHYFVKRITAEAPNTTTLVLQRDVWMDYINTTTINGLLLARGHAPLTETTPAALLANPRAKCRDFTLPDVDYGNAASNVRKSTPYNLQNGARYICLAATFSPEQLQAMSNVRGTNITDTDPTYSDNDGVVTGFAWGAGNIYTSNVTGAGTSYHSVDNLTASNVSMYALETSKISSDYFDTLFAYYPHIMSQITAVFVATANMMQFNSSVNVNGIEWHAVSGARTKISDINLTINDFGYANEYAQITRLYLAPYAYLEISDNIGNKTRVEIADCGHLSAQAITSLSYPILRQIAWLDGIGSDGDTAINIDAIDGASITADVPNADMLKTLISHDIPTYALQRRAIDAYRADAYNREVAQARENAIIAYENGARSANTGELNANAAATTAKANVNATNATSVANTARGVIRDNAATTENNNTRNDMLTYSNTRLDTDLTSTNIKIYSDYGNDMTLMNKAFIEGSQNSAITSVTSMVGTVGSAALTIATGGAAAPIAAGAIAVGSAALQGYNTGMTISNNAELNATANNVANFKQKQAQATNREQTAHAKTQAASTTARANTQATNLTKLATDATTEINNNNVNTSNANANRTYGTTVGNAARSRNTSIANAKNVMTNTRSNVSATWRDLLNHAAQPVGAYGGDNFGQATGLDTMTVKIVTEDNGAIAAAGDYMLRYGIASNKLYNKPNLTPCNHFTYWQAGDVWLTNNLAGNDALDTIRERLTDGVTIWNDPDEIGGDYLTANLNQ